MSDKVKVSFGKIFWPSLVAVILATIFGLLLFFGILGGIVAGFSADFEPKEMTIKPNTVLYLKLDDPVTETSKMKFSPYEMSMNGSIGLSDLLTAIDAAKENKNIKGIYIELSDLSCGYATAMELRNALSDFKKSGKFIVAYHSGEVITQKEYYLASVANENYGFPSSMFEFVGLGVEMMYFKNLLGKLSIEMQIIRGKDNAFKSAVEPYFLDKMSDSSRVQTERYLTSIWSDIIHQISADRNVSEAQLNELADSVSIRRADDAVKYGLLDASLYQDEVLGKLREKLNLKTGEKFPLLEMEKYARKVADTKRTLDDARTPTIAVVFAEGGIATSGDGISSAKLVEQLRKVRDDKHIKIVVLRVNSPGGSALASAEIWREVMLIKQQKKIIVSMGDVAASGGYYISAAATRIFAEPTTITGSIGVFGIIPYTGAFLSEKIGLSFDYAGTNKHAVLSTNRKISPEEMETIQTEVNQTYSEFLSVVAQGRNLSVERVNQLARGRVWTGRDALQIGLVDELGGLNEAIRYAVKTAGIKNPVFAFYPEKKENKFMEFLQNIEDQEDFTKDVKLPQAVLQFMNQFTEIESLKGIQMRMPYYMEIH